MTYVEIPVICSRSVEWRSGASGTGIRLHINSEALQPLQNGLVGAPADLAPATHGFHAVDGIPLQVEIDGGVSVRGRWAGVPEPLANCGQIDTRLQES